MIITDDFVLLNFPKTGTTFTRKIIQKIYEDDYEELLLPVAFNIRDIGRRTQHGTYAQIPIEHRGKTVLSIMRNPFDRYISQYCFKWYAHSPPESIEKIRATYPSFPEMEFVDFLDMSDRFTKKNVLKAYNIFLSTDIGTQTINFIAFYSNTPESDLNEMIQNNSDPFLKLPKIHFLHQESLRKELCDFLVGLHRDKDIEKIISSQEDMNVSRPSEERNLSQFWNPDLHTMYSKKERFLLNAFPEYR